MLTNVVILSSNLPLASKKVFARQTTCYDVIAFFKTMREALLFRHWPGQLEIVQRIVCILMDGQIGCDCCWFSLNCCGDIAYFFIIEFIDNKTCANKLELIYIPGDSN